MKNSLCVITLATVTWSAVAVGAATGQQRVVSVDSVFAVTLPSQYVPVQVNSEASLQFGDTASESYVLAIAESKEDLFGWNLIRHSSITVAQMLVATDFPELSIRNDTSYAGIKAVQYRLRGVVQGTQVAYLHTTFDLKNAFLQVVMWTKQSHWPVAAAEYEAILNSLEPLMDPNARGFTEPTPFEIVPGVWAWEEGDNTCAGATQTFEVAPDRQSMLIRHSEPYETESGDSTDVTEYVIEGSTTTTLQTYIPDETRTTDDGDPVRWDLVVLARDLMAWHRTDWASGNLTKSLVRCSTE